MTGRSHMFVLLLSGSDPYHSYPIITEICPPSTEYERIAAGLSDALDFSRTIGAYPGGAYETGGGKGPLGEVDFYTRYSNQRRSMTRWYDLLAAMRV